MTARILAGAVLSTALSPLCGLEAEKLLKKRGKSFFIESNETVIFVDAGGPCL